ncbi:hypothetical protein [Chamaesiphon sp. GL140_3_metabinner_50]|uniref:hypothetical protein n=1 Tax=Chamaesiphon sp. GL140_3_metabinner_50 TaxID=2970812 RepID=UPI0025FD688E|nr:hypothetical protein [Chamaesiphon sp. GL140_3_metabinner_50]
MNPRLSWNRKLIGTALLGSFSVFWYLLMVAIYWETVSLKCQPNPELVICTITGEPYPGRIRSIEVPKQQLAGVEIVDRQSRGKYRIGLITRDRQEIPLTKHWNGDATAQIETQLGRISAFINDPNAKTLTIETHRDFPLLALVMTVGVIGFCSLSLKRLWLGFKT